MRRLILIFIVLTGLVPVMRAETAHAYEADVHYAWTYYLALHVGYTKRQAFQLASATYAIDESPATSPMEADRGEVIYGARHPGIRPLEHRTGPNERIAEIWTKFHAFRETNYENVPGMVEEGRRKRIAFLWDLAKREGNPGPMMPAPQKGCKPNCEVSGTWICENPQFFEGWNRADSCPAKDPETRRPIPVPLIVRA